MEDTSTQKSPEDGRNDVSVSLVQEKSDHSAASVPLASLSLSLKGKSKSSARPPSGSRPGSRSGSTASTPKENNRLGNSSSGDFFPNKDSKSLLAPSPLSQISAMKNVADNKEVLVAGASLPFCPAFPIRDEMVGPQHFKKLKLLGQGGIGKVYLVLLKGTQMLYAMKVLTKEEMIRKNKIQRVMTEREILASANHPFIVTMYASFQTNKRLCFVMEFCEGGEFFRILQKQPKRRLKESTVQFYAAEVTLALEYLHYHGFVYRDLKPENILMRRTGHIAITDFDLSKQTSSSGTVVVEERKLTISEKVKGVFSMRKGGSKLNMLEIVTPDASMEIASNSFVGTEEYIAPEVVNGVPQSAAVDWWTLGVLIYEMLTGTTPFKGNTIEATFSNILNQNLKWPDDVETSTEAKKLVKQLLAREVEKRLGHNGAQEVKEHRFFKDVDFVLIRNADAPIIPDIGDPLNMDQYKEMDDDDEDGVPQNVDAPENPFSSFNLRRDSEIVNRTY